MTSKNKLKLENISSSLLAKAIKNSSENTQREIAEKLKALL